MSFWAVYRPPSTQERFTDYRAPLLQVEPSGVTIERYSPDMSQFLRDEFGGALQSRPPPFSSEDEFVVARSSHGTIVGCGHVSNQPSFFEGHPIYPTDWLCVAAAHRGTGLTTRILSTGYSYLRHKGLHHCIYLKEGKPMGFATPPLYSSTYVFRRSEGGLQNPGPPVSPQTAGRLMAAIRQVRPATFILHSEALSNQTWRFWKRGLSWCLMGFQDAYQTFQGGTVGTLSAFFSANCTGPVVEALIDSAPFDWVWADRAFLKDTAGWQTDGPFHWYTYQWSTCCVPSDQYCLMV